jgi:hypothetical protein
MGRDWHWSGCLWTKIIEFGSMLPRSPTGATDLPEGHMSQYTYFDYDGAILRRRAGAVGPVNEIWHQSERRWVPYQGSGTKIAMYGDIIQPEKLPPGAAENLLGPKPKPRYRPYAQVLTERTRPEPIFVAALTGVDVWLRLDFAPEILVRSPGQKLREIGAAMRTHYAMRKGIAGPFGKITGYVFRPSPDRALRYSSDGVLLGPAKEPAVYGEVSMGLR